MTVITVLIAIAAGFVSFVSPCCLPMVPVYLSYMLGANPTGDRHGRLVALRHSIAFVLGFSLVFVALWASVGLVGYVLRDYAGILRLVGGAVLIVMGLHVAGLIRISVLYRDVRLPVGRLLGPPARPAATRTPATAAATAAGHCAPGPEAAAPDGAVGTIVDGAADGSGTAATEPVVERRSYGKSGLLGVAFAAGWTPCIGPFLGFIIGLASASESVGRGTTLLVAYAAGLGIPFILVAVGATEVNRRFGWFRRHNAGISLAAGLMLVVVGFLIITNLFARLSGTLPNFGI